VWQFGDGLSYSDFKITMGSTGSMSTGSASTGSASTGSASTGSVFSGTTYAVDVTNAGTMAGAATVLVYFQLIKQADADSTASANLPVLPNRQCLGFDGIMLTPGTKGTLHFAVADADLALVDEAGSEVIVAGEYQLVFSDGTTELVSKLTLPASAARTISTLPPGAPGPAPASGQ
jgi:hypothetical protein